MSETSIIKRDFWPNARFSLRKHGRVAGVHSASQFPVPHLARIHDTLHQFFPFFLGAPSQLARDAAAAAAPSNLDQRTTVAQAHLAALDFCGEANLLKVALLLPRAPDARDQLVPRPDGAGKPSLILFDVCRIAAAKFPEDQMTSRVPRVQAVDDDAAKAHLPARFGRRVQGVVVAVETVQVRRLVGGLVRQHGVRLPVFRGREVLGGRALGPVPAALADEEGARRHARVDVAARAVDQVRLHVEDGAGPALVVDAEDFGPGLERPAGRAGGQRLEEFHLALAVHHALVVKVGHPRDLDSLGGGVEVYDILCVALES